MKRLLVTGIAAFACVGAVFAKPRTFTNSDGKTVTAELMAVEGESAVLKLGSGSTAKVPLKSLSEDDQTYIAEWWKENKDKIKPMDVRLSIDKKTDRIDRKVSHSGGQAAPRPGQNQPSPVVKKNTIDEFKYACELKSYVRKEISEIKVDYTIYKRISTSDKTGSKTVTEEIDGNTTIPKLEALGSATFETDTVKCEDNSETGGNKPRTLKRETILGVVFSLSAGGEEFLRQSDPETLLDRMEEEEKRQDAR